MGFNNTTTTLTAKFTPIGRERLIQNASNLITQFALGDSDANYYCTLDLGLGEIPSMGGDLTSTSGLTSNTVTTNVVMNNKLYAKNGSFFKNVESGSNRLVQSFESLGQSTVLGNLTSVDVISRSATTTDPLVNLYRSFKLPITSSDDLAYTNKTLSQGGWSDTALASIASDKIVVVSILNESYGDMLDGKEVNFSVSGTTGGTYNLYSTFQNKQGNIALDDSRLTETSSQTAKFAPNYAFLFSDQIKRPNGDVSKSWATGFGTIKPFSANGKSRYNLTTNNTLGLSADTAVGIVFLDKGLIVITDSTIVNDVTGTTSADTVTFGSASSIVNQEFTCIASRGQFTRSNNPTYVDGDTPRISEVGLYDNNGNMIAYGKTDAHIPKTANELKAFSVRINV